MEQYLPVRKTVQEQGGRIKVRQYFIGAILSFGLILNASPAEGFLNRDCSNLKKRTIANQKSYEKAWDKYQTAYGNWQEITDAGTQFRSPEAVNRLRATFRIAEKTLNDLNKFPECLKKGKWVGIPSELGRIASAYKDLDGNLGFALYKNYLSSPIDYTSYLK